MNIYPKWKLVNDIDMYVRVAYVVDTITLHNHRVDAKISDYAVPAVIVTIIDDNTKRICVGVSRCGPKDKYNPKMGREIAAGRALKLWIDQEIYTGISGVELELDEDNTYEVLALYEKDTELFLRIKHGE